MADRSNLVGGILSLSDQENIGAEEVYWVIYQAFVGTADSVGDDTTILKSGLIVVFPLVGAHRSLTKSL